MKRKLLTIVSAVALTIAAVSFNSCTKQEDATQGTDKQTQNPEMTQEDVAFYNSITGFKQKIKYIKENPMYKSGEFIGVDSALWLMESTFNYEYGSVGDNYREVKPDSAFLEIETGGNGEMGLNELTVAYYNMFNAVQEIYSNTSFDDKGLILVSLDIVATNNSTTTVKVETITGNKGIDPNPGPFGEDDYWRYGMKEGTCDYEQDTTDSARKIWFKTNANITPPPYPPPGYCYSYSDPVTWTVEGGDEKWRRPGDPMNNYLDYYLYFANTAVTPFNNSTLCLEPNEMNNYYNYLQQIIYNWLPEEPGMENHDFLIVSNFKGQPYSYPLKYQHWGTLEYAIRHLVLCPPPVDPELGD